MKLLRLKFLIFIMVVFLGVQPVVRCNTDLSFGQRCMLYLASDPQRANSAMGVLYVYDFLITMWIAKLVLDFMQEDKKVVLKVQNGPGQPIYDVMVDAELAERIMQKNNTQGQRERFYEVI